MDDVVIIGSGPAGLTAAIYACRANLSTTVVAGSAWGGQLMLTTEVENFPGFPDPILGPDLMENMRRQAEKFGAKIVYEDATKVDFSARPFKVFAGGEELEARSVIIATGASSKWLGLESEERLRGRGVSSCAACDGMFFRGKKVAVVGGGDTALEEALTLAKIASQVTVVHRRDKLRASKVLQERALGNGKIGFAWNAVVVEILGKEKVEGIRIKDVQTGQESTIYCDGVFVAIGHQPNTELFKGQVELDPMGYVVTHEGSRTSVEGVFAAGDVQDHKYRQAVTAAASGCKAALDAEKWLQVA
ncbi:MAG: thioredoxin-disulfide reductase [Candidatus Brockarchaeota archaeon]|nr:thioredoxin-disulfide reductase [Candidatus Brockarchaeota archaeon]